MKKYLFVFLFLFTGTFSFSQINEGDTLQFWSVSYVDWPPLWGTPQRVVNAICKKAGVHCYVFVEDVATQPSQAAIDTLVHHFDYHYYPELTPLYGPVPDQFDNDSSIIILAFNETNWAGYFDPGQQMADTFMYSHWGMRSNQHEMIYIGADYFNSAAGIVSHEFGHLLHWQQDHSPEPIANPVKYWEEAWIDEGFSTFAAEYLTQDISQQGVMHYNAFFANNPDLPLIYFLSGASYDQVLMWTVFMYEHYGGPQYIKMLIKEQANGVEGMRKTLDSLGVSESFEDIFEQWIVANYIDDAVFDGGRYSYAHFDFPMAQQTFTHNAYPTGNKTQSVTAFGADYNIFNTTDTGQLAITFNADSTYKFRLAFMLLNTAGDEVIDVISVLPDQQGLAVFTAADFGTDYNRVVMAVMCIDTSLAENETAAYSYSADLATSAIDENNAESLFTIFPVPSKDKILVTVKGNIYDSSGVYEILGVDGKLIAKGIFTSESFEIDIAEMKPASYFLRVSIPGGVYIKKIIKN